jgi:RimJ/RimL family protein N-acetyltransferase
MPDRDPLDPGKLAFRPLAMGDLRQLHAWFNAPHARRWFGKGRSFESIVEEYAPDIAGSTPIHPFLVSYAGKAIGWVSWECFGDAPDFMRTYGVDDPNAVNCDVLIGDAEFVQRGLGAPLLRRFLSEIVFSDPRYTSCVIDPVEDNTIAIRAYEKAGFCYLRTVADDGEGNRLHLMEMRRSRLVARN